MGVWKRIWERQATKKTEPLGTTGGTTETQTQPLKPEVGKGDVPRDPSTMTLEEQAEDIVNSLQAFPEPGGATPKEREELAIARKAVTDAVLLAHSPTEVEAARKALEAFQTKLLAVEERLKSKPDDLALEIQEELKQITDPVGATSEEKAKFAAAREEVTNALKEPVTAVSIEVARKQLEAYRTLISEIETRIKTELTELAKQVLFELNAIADPSGATTKELSAITTARGGVTSALGTPLSPEQIEEARRRLDDVRKAVASVGVRKEVTEVSPQDEYPRLGLKISDITGYPDQYSSAAITRLKTAVSESDRVYKQKEVAYENDKTGENLEALREALNTLKTALSDAAKPVREHDKEVRAYYAKLKASGPEMNLADRLPATNPSTGPTAWNAERLAYDAQKLLVKNAADLKDYKKANEELEKLVKPGGALPVLIAKRVDSLDAEISTAATGPKASGKKARTLVSNLSQTPGLIGALKPQQQLDLLGVLRSKIISCNTCGKGMTEEEFQLAGYECNDTTCASSNIEYPGACNVCETPGKPGTSARCTYVCQSKNRVGNACGDCGGSWTTTRTKCRTQCTGTGHFVDQRIRSKFNDVSTENRPLLEARATIFGEMKMDPKFVEKDKKMRKDLVNELKTDPDFKDAEKNWAQWSAKANGPTGTEKAEALQKMEAFFNKVIATQCKKMGHDQQGLTRDGETFPDVPVKVKFFQGKPGLFGQCNAGFPTHIEINTAGAHFGEFKEQLDTIIHENAHAWQEMIIKKMKAEVPFADGTAKTQIENDPELAIQAKLFVENDLTYINSDSIGTSGAALKLAQKAYRHEPVEEHAWNFGGSCSQSLLVPPPVRSFESKRGLKNKIFFVESLKRSDPAVVKFKERHGFYGEEWQGENAEDKKLSIENIPGGTRAIRIESVVDDYTLELDFDASGLQEDPNNAGFVDAKAARVILDESVADI